MSVRSELAVHLDAPELGPLQPVGTLSSARTRGLLDVAFAYDPGWLATGPRIDLDPELGRYEGDQRPARGALHGIFADTTPDRWGRMLLRRWEAHRSRREGRAPRNLDDWDHLVGVRDDLRTGALRLRHGEEFIASGAGVPPMTRLRELQSYARRAERGEEVAPEDAETEASLLIAPGSSLGGARPKANVVHEDGTLWIAKFPSRDDLRDVEAWEQVMVGIAAGAGIPVPDTALLRVAGEHRTFCARRFDRAGGGRRLFASAMTLAAKRDGDEASYLDIVEAIELYGDPGTIDQELEQLFRRAVFAVLAGHRDDHLRNHGFIHTGRGWRLSPAFDLNPVPERAEHVLAFDGDARFPDVDLLMSTVGFYRLRPARASEILGEVRGAVARWRDAAREAGLSRDEVDLMSAAFRP